MKEQIIRTYEADYEFFLSEAARCTIEKDNSEIELERSIMVGEIIAFKGAAFVMYYRLRLLCPTRFSGLSSVSGQCHVDQEVEKIIKEKTNHEQKTQPLS